MNTLKLAILLFVGLLISSCGDKVESSNYYGSWIGTADCPGATYFDSNVGGNGTAYRTDAFQIQINMNDSFGTVSNGMVFMEAFSSYGFCAAPENLIWTVDGRNLNISIDEAFNNGTNRQIVGSATLSEDRNTLTVNYTKYHTWSNANTCDIICNFVLTRQ